MPNLLLTGGSGLLALNWARATAGSWSVHRLEHERRVSWLPSIAERGDLSSIQHIAALLDRIKPDLLVNCAGMTSVEACEADPEGASQANVVMPARLAEACRIRAIPMVHVSTDHLFDDGITLYAEDHPPAPLNVYGHTKAQGERAVLAANADVLVIRTNFFGWGTRYRRSFSDTIIASLRAGEPILLFSDVFFTPILMDDLIKAVHRLVSLRVTGLVNAVGDERLSKYEFGLGIAQVFGLDADLIQRGQFTDRPGLVQRPRQMGLDNSRMRLLLGAPVGNVAEQLRRLAALEADQQVKEIQQL